MFFKTVFEIMIKEFQFKFIIVLMRQITQAQQFIPYYLGVFDDREMNNWLKQMYMNNGRIVIKNKRSKIE